MTYHFLGNKSDESLENEDLENVKRTMQSTPDNKLDEQHNKLDILLFENDSKDFGYVMLTILSQVM